MVPLLTRGFAGKTIFQISYNYSPVLIIKIIDVGVLLQNTVPDACLYGFLNVTDKYAFLNELV